MISDVPGRTHVRLMRKDTPSILNAEIYYKSGKTFYKITAKSLGLMLDDLIEISPKAIILNPSNSNIGISFIEGFEFMKISQEEFNRVMPLSSDEIILEKDGDFLDNNYSR